MLKSLVQVLAFLGLSLLAPLALASDVCPNFETSYQKCKLKDNDKKIDASKRHHSFIQVRDKDSRLEKFIWMFRFDSGRDVVTEIKPDGTRLEYTPGYFTTSYCANEELHVKYQEEMEPGHLTYTRKLTIKIGHNSELQIFEGEAPDKKLFETCYP